MEGMQEIEPENQRARRRVSTELSATAKSRI